MNAGKDNALGVQRWVESQGLLKSTEPFSILTIAGIISLIQITQQATKQLNLYFNPINSSPVNSSLKSIGAYDCQW